MNDENTRLQPKIYTDAQQIALNSLLATCQKHNLSLQPNIFDGTIDILRIKNNNRIGTINNDLTFDYVGILNLFLVKKISQYFQIITSTK